MAPLSSLHGIVWHWHCVAWRLGCADPLCDVGKLLPRVFPPAWPKKPEGAANIPVGSLVCPAEPGGDVLQYSPPFIISILMDFFFLLCVSSHFS